MKIIKTMLAGMVLLVFATGQDNTQGGPPPGPPACDPNMTYPVADPGPDGGCANYNDCNGNGAYDLGEPCGDMPQGPPPFESVDANGDGAIDREEARAVFGIDNDGNEDPEFDADFDDNDTNGDGVLDPAEHDAANAKHAQGPHECDVCGHQFTGPDDYHGHCDKCDYVFSGNDQHGHCDKCDYVFSGNDQHGHCNECDYIFSGTDDHHGHCDKCDHIFSGNDDKHGHCSHDGCDFVGNSDEDWANHNHGGTGGPGTAPTNHWDGNCEAICGGMSDYFIDSDGDGAAEDGPYAVWDHDADGNPVDCGCGGPGPAGPPPFDAIDANGDGVVNEDEARAFFSMDPDFTEEEFQNDFARVDANGDGSVDEGEHDDEAVRQIAGKVFGESMANGDSPDEAFNNVADAVHGYVVGGGRDSQENFDNARNAAWNAFQDALANGATPEDAFGAAMAAAGEANNDGGGN